MDEPAGYEVELFLDSCKIHRKKGSLSFFDGTTTYYDTSAQAQIDATFGGASLAFSQNPMTHFLEKAPKDQLEFVEGALFNSGVEIKEVKARFKENKYALDREKKELNTKIEMVQEFLRKLGPAQEIVDVAGHEGAGLDKNLVFLENKLSLYRQYTERRTELQKRCSYLGARIEDLKKARATTIPYTEEQLYAHSKVKKELETLQYERYQEYTVEECQQIVKEYEEDLDVLLRASPTRCPSCASLLSVDEGSARVIDEPSDPLKISAILKDFSVECAQEGIKEIRKQIKLFESYASKRAQIDYASTSLLNVKNERELLEELKNSHKRAYELSSVEKEQEETRARLNALNNRASDIFATIEEDKKKLLSAQKRMEDEELYKIRLKDSQTRVEYTTKLEELTKVYLFLERRLDGLSRALSVLLRTEQEFIGGALEDLCEKVNCTLTRLFTTDIPIVRLEIEATTGGVKALKVSFARLGNDKYTYAMFSSGEKTRLNIAFLLAFAEIKKYKILLLDEATGHLNEDVATRVICHVKEAFKGRIVLTSLSDKQSSNYCYTSSNIARDVAQ